LSLIIIIQLSNQVLSHTLTLIKDLAYQVSFEHKS